MDRSLSPSRWSAGRAARHLGSWKFAGIVGRGDTGHPRRLRARSALYETRGARPRSLEATRSPVEAEILFPHRSAVDGRRRRRIRAWLTSLPERRRNPFRTARRERTRAPLAADQL